MVYYYIGERKMMSYIIKNIAYFVVLLVNFFIYSFFVTVFAVQNSLITLNVSNQTIMERNAVVQEYLLHNAVKLTGNINIAHDEIFIHNLQHNLSKFIMQYSYSSEKNNDGSYYLHIKLAQDLLYEFLMKHNYKLWPHPHSKIILLYLQNKNEEQNILTDDSIFIENIDFLADINKTIVDLNHKLGAEIIIPQSIVIQNFIEQSTLIKNDLVHFLQQQYNTNFVVQLSNTMNLCKEDLCNKNNSSSLTWTLFNKNQVLQQKNYAAMNIDTVINHHLHDILYNSVALLVDHDKKANIDVSKDLFAEINLINVHSVSAYEQLIALFKDDIIKNFEVKNLSKDKIKLHVHFYGNLSNLTQWLDRKQILQKIENIDEPTSTASTDKVNILTYAYSGRVEQ